ncbi:MAG: type II toxin-antitoxin system VapC family toxin [Aigarchaeota archaeon]|nr:type II toxin-antitoxin system VapC family toxin [Candidatus Geocrenenecus dongiae]
MEKIKGKRSFSEVINYLIASNVSLRVEKILSLSNYFTGREDEMLESLKDKIEDIGISRLTEYELMVGAFYLWKKYGNARELAWLDEVLKWLTIYEVDEEVIKLASKIKSEALLNGERETIYDIDLLIAVSGKSGSALLTLDKNQFKLKNYLENIGITILSYTNSQF